MNIITRLAAVVLEHIGFFFITLVEVRFVAIAGEIIEHPDIALLVKSLQFFN